MSTTVRAETTQVTTLLALAEVEEARISELQEEDCRPENRYNERQVYDFERDLWLYRNRTVALLKRYARMSVEAGRLASMLGRECLGTTVTPYAMTSFEEAAIFVHDVRSSLEKLHDWQIQILMLSFVEEYSQWEVARLIGRPLRSVEREIADALDELSRTFLARGVMREICSGKN